MASSEPRTSALSTTLSVLRSPAVMLSNILSSLDACWRCSLLSRILVWRESAISRARFSLSTTANWSPASGVPFRPRISTGILGPACSIGWPFSSSIARTRPNWVPASTTSPRRSVPDWISSDATGPRPLSRRDSITIPCAGTSLAAVNSSTSACSNTASSSSLTPSPVRAETLINWVSPPQASGMTSWAASSFLTRSGSAPSLSILFTATISGTPAARACCTASIVCGITPSSAATTRMTMSVLLAPRARIAVKAAWPGVSRKEIMPWSVST